ncbi:MAG: succinate dehydrogenase assembly factor 2 [Pseudomonadota bacterium]
MIPPEELNRMRWAARRGMLELDLVLEPFLRDGYQDLTPEERGQFALLMTCEDQELYAWLLQREHPTDPGLGAIVQKIRAISASRRQS